jgi:outer membrane protein OmpA-like peptidoglycan-associated protein
MKKHLFSSRPRAALGVALATAILSGCATYDPYTGERKVSKATKYGAGAAVVCGLIGATRNGRSARNAALGCGLIGASVGAYMDHQEAELRRELEGTGVRVVRDGDQIRLIMPSNITFNVDEYNIRSEFYPVLNSVAKVLKKYKDTRLNIDGHTDSTGPDDYNQKLSEERAYSVADYLASQGIAPSRLVPRGHGERYPIATNATPEGREQNRRVELTITPLPPEE